MRFCALSSKKFYKIVKKYIAFFVKICYIESKQKDDTIKQ